MRWVWGLGAVVLALAPLAFAAAGAEFWTLILTRGVIYAIAALGLQLVLGRGGLVSFGFAAFIGIGAYVVGIAAHHGLDEGLIAIPLAMAAAAAFACLTGAVALRTRGVYFIMITLAFGQMAYYLATSLSSYGGDDGMTLWSRSLILGTGAIEGRAAFYYFCLACLAGAWALLRMVGRSHFGRIIDGARQNEARMRALGFDVFRYQLGAYVLAGAIGGLAGALLANHAEFVSPAYMTWKRSGELIVMVVLGGVSSLNGVAAGALGVVLLQDILAQATEYWRLAFGLVALGVALGLLRGPGPGALARWFGR